MENLEIQAILERAVAEVVAPVWADAKVGFARRGRPGWATRGENWGIRVTVYLCEREGEPDGRTHFVKSKTKRAFREFVAQHLPAHKRDVVIFQSGLSCLDEVAPGVIERSDAMGHVIGVHLA